LVGIAFDKHAPISFTGCNESSWPAAVVRRRKLSFGRGEARRRRRSRQTRADSGREAVWTRAQVGPRGPIPGGTRAWQRETAADGRECSRGTPWNGAEAEGPRRRRRGGRTGATRDGADTDRTPAQAGGCPAEADANGVGEREPQSDLGPGAVALARRAVRKDGSGRLGALRREGTQRGGRTGGRRRRCGGRKAEREAEPSAG
jgi:hypothetical protein